MVLGGAALYIGRTAEDTWLWRGAQYDKLTKLHAGFDLTYFEDQLGPPTVSRTSKGYQVSAFRGRDFWVQAISHGNSVELYAVTSCDESFHPTFRPLGADLPIELNRSQLADIAPPSQSLMFDYFVGATAPTLFYEGIYGGFAGYYKTFTWGWSSLCFEENDHLMTPGSHGPSSGFTADLTSRAEDFRRETQVNTYAETAPATLPGSGGDYGLSMNRRPNLHQFHGFYVGPDRVLLQASD